MQLGGQILDVYAISVSTQLKFASWSEQFIEFDTQLSFETMLYFRKIKVN